MKATSKKNQVQMCFRFPGIFLSNGYIHRGQNDTHYEIVGVDIILIPTPYRASLLSGTAILPKPHRTDKQQ